MIFEIGRTAFNLRFSFIAFIVFMLLVYDEEIIVLSICSSLVHESGHLFLIYFLGDKPKTVELSLFGMRIDRFDSVKLSYKKEALIALGGIIFNLIFAVCCYIIYLEVKKSIFFKFAFVNLIIIIVNSVPVSVLDFGRALKYILLLYFDSEKCSKILNIISYIFVFLFSIITLFYCVFSGVNLSLIAVTLYIFTITLIKKWS